MRMMIKFVKSIDLFMIPDQVVDDERTLDEGYNALTKVPLPVIDWTEQEVIDLDTVTRPIEHVTKKWLDNQVAQL